MVGRLRRIHALTSGWSSVKRAGAKGGTTSDTILRIGRGLKQGDDASLRVNDLALSLVEC